MAILSLVIWFNCNPFYSNSNNSGYDESLISNVDDYDTIKGSIVAPWTITKFQGVLDNAKIQAPTSTDLFITSEIIAGAYDVNYWYGDSDGYMLFTVTGDSKRSEIRDYTEWYTNTTSTKKLSGTYKLITGEPLEVTFAQIHDSLSNPNKPLLRLTVGNEWQTTGTNNVWVMAITSWDGSTATYDKIDTGVNGYSDFTYEITVLNNIMTVKINGIQKYTDNVSFYQSFPCYFKAGVYNQTTGTSLGQYSTLTVSY